MERKRSNSTTDSGLTVDETGSRLAPIIHWRCPNCGQTYFSSADDQPPDMCAYCHDMTTWENLGIPPV